MEEQKNNYNVAILSPNEENAYSETFIRAHRDLIRNTVFFYEGGVVPTKLNGVPLSNDKVPGVIGTLDSKLVHLQNSLMENGIDVVLAEFGHTAVESLPAIYGANIPLVVHFHGVDAHSQDLLNIYAKRYQDVFQYAYAIIVVSSVMKKQLMQLGCPAEKIFQTACAPNNEYFSLRPSFTNQQFFLMGRFVDKKAPYYSILAFYEALRAFPHAKLVLAGDGPLLNTCKNLVRYLGIQKQVSFLGSISREQVKKEMEQSLGFVQHSIQAENGDSEGTPVAILEAGAAGLPVIATRHAGIMDVVIDYKTGLLCDEHDVSAMGTALQILLGDHKLAQQLGQAARKRVKTFFSMERHIELIDGLLVRAAQKGNSIHIERRQIYTYGAKKKELVYDLWVRSIRSPQKMLTFPYNLIKIFFL